MAIVAIIPARFGSTRLPGKPLSQINGKPMVQHVWERARLAQAVDRVLVATDDERIAEVVRAFGGEVVMTSQAHATGTDRLAEAAAGTDAEIVVNVQGDEPMLDASFIDGMVAPLRAEADLPMSTVSLPLTDVEEMLSSAVVKVVSDARGHALYFSRSPIPFVRDAVDMLRDHQPEEWLRAAAVQAVSRRLARKHVGLYAYRREALLRFASLPPAPLEQAESLEQLRALHHGMKIRVVPMEGQSGVAVDTPQDLERVRAIMAGGAFPNTRKTWLPNTSS
ncbi:MAG TPA: 3-deoxy-manno-octulosonate cytidylyltransferase [Vicinamibacteria bacterium]|nr:3-deoxy-manno-octulosonate cytidylyltransferase [Vicinamibacteria bacterium]